MFSSANSALPLVCLTSFLLTVTYPSFADAASAASSSHTSSAPTNLFKEYLNKGLLQCTSKYVHRLSKLHALIKEAFEEYTECEKQLREAPGKKPTENELLDRLLAEMDADEEDGTAGQSASPTEVRELSNGTVNKNKIERQHQSIRARRSLANFVVNRL
ncbi:hypothetical protein AAVH_38327 [Aphelenchoides avenae]|nr:hypothetical protein AAVH_38327 [Aphelenchus avenae]